MQLKGFIGGSYTSRAIAFDQQRCVNLFPEIDESQLGKEAQIGFLVSTPGLSVVSSAGSSAGRAGGVYATSTGRLFFINGDKLEEKTSITGASTSIGTLSTSTGPVCMTDNGLQLVVVDGTYGYTYGLGVGGSFAKITDADMPKASRCAYQDGYVIFNDVGSQKFYITALLNASDIGTLDFASAEGSPDRLVSIIDCHRELWLLGEQSTEIWVNTGNSVFPFERVNGSFIEHGCSAAQSVSKIDNTIFWLGGGDSGHGIVWRAEGFSPKRISTHAIENYISKYATSISDAYAYCYSESGHQFYVLSIPGLSSSLCYDVATGLWHERSSIKDFGEITEEDSRHRSNGYAYFSGKHVVNDYETNDIYEMSMDHNKDGASPIRWKRATPFISSGLKRVFFRRLQIDIQAGIGDQTTSTAPIVLMRYTDDGVSWSTPRDANSGKAGDYLHRCIWNSLGCSRSRCIEISGQSDSKVILMGAEIELEQGDN